MAITLKSRREIDLMRAAGRIVAEAHRTVQEMIRPGVTTGELDAAVERLFVERGATSLFKGYPGRVPFPAVTCISVNEEVVHGIPGERRLKQGDIISVDTGCKLAGWCGDAAWTYPVGEVDDVKSRLLATGEAVLRTAIREIGRQKMWSDVARVMEAEAKRAGFSVVEDFVGHGIGREMHEDPQVPNFVSAALKREDFKLQPGLVLAVEPMVNAGRKAVRILPDHWTVATRDRAPSVHFEHTIALTETGVEVLTRGIAPSETE